MTSKYFRLLTCFLIFLCSFLFLSHKNHTAATPSCIAPTDVKIDEFEHHFLAVNFALFNRFPILGYLADTTAYHICANPESAFYLNSLKKNGPVVVLNRSPVYPVLYGSLYKVFGVVPLLGRYLNIFLLSLIAALMPALGYRRWRWPGFISGVCSAVIYILTQSVPVNDLDAESLTTFMSFMILAAGLQLRFDSGFWAYFVMGVTIAIAMLTKGIYSPLPVFLIFFVLIHIQRADELKPRLIRISALLAGLILLLTPSVIYMNVVRLNSMTERSAWMKKNLEDTPVLSEKNRNATKREEFTMDDETKMKLTQFIIVDKNRLNVTEPGFMILTNQAVDNSLLMVNNEYCTDGFFHPEWQLLSHSYYQHDQADRPILVRILGFYQAHPSLLPQILAAKLDTATSEAPSFFWGAIVCWAAIVLHCRISFLRRRVLRSGLSAVVLSVVGVSLVYIFVPVHLIALWVFFPFILLAFALYRADFNPDILYFIGPYYMGMIILTLITFGESRHIQAYAPVSIFCFCYFSYLFFRTLITGQSRAQKPLPL